MGVLVSETWSMVELGDGRSDPSGIQSATSRHLRGKPEAYRQAASFKEPTF